MLESRSVAAESPLTARSLGYPLFATTLSVLTLELALTRLFSVVLFYHYAFLVISMALLGLGCGAIVARLTRTPASMRLLAQRLGFCCMVAGASLLPILLAILKTRVWLLSMWETFSTLSSLYLLCMVPFALAGYVIATVMKVGSERVASLYFFDLLGAGCGCLIFVPLINRVGGPNTVLAVIALWFVAAAVWGMAARRRELIVIGLGAPLIVAVIIVMNLHGNVLEVQYLRGAPRKNELFTRWNSFSRVDVFRDQNGLHWIEIDGGAGTQIADIDFGGPSGGAFIADLGHRGPDLAFVMSSKPKALIIGPGGGIDIARAIAAGSPSVTAVEINPIIANDIMRGQFARISHRIYSRPEVQVHVEDGRTFVQRTRDRYDVVQLSQVDTWASSASGAYSLTESYLYTVDAVENYLNRLTPGGIVSISRWEFPRPRETLRLVSVALEALRRLNVASPEQHVLVVLQQFPGAIQKMGTLLISRRPFSQDDIAGVRRRIAGATGLSIAYAPGDPTVSGPFAELIRSADRDRYIRDYPFDISPVYDDRPFFFFTGRWSNFWRGRAGVDLTGDALNTSAQFLLLALLIASAGAVCLFIFVPLLLFGQAFPAERRGLPYLMFALAVGIGFILIEVSLIQKFVVFLGQPVYSLTVVIFLLLVASSAGSRFTGRFSSQRLPQVAGAALFGIVVLVAFYFFSIDSVIRHFQPSAQQTKIAIVAAIIAPLGFMMGMPFPSALRLTALSRASSIEWVWALNAAATVFGSILAIFLAVIAGITNVMLIGGGAYAAAAMLVLKMRRFET